jgi:hypothetical protein
MIFTVNELVYAGIDPSVMRFKRTGCFDVGVDCGGWGHIVMEVRVEEAKALRTVVLNNSFSRVS